MNMLVKQCVNVADGEGVVLPEHGVDRGLRQGPGLQQHSKVNRDKMLWKRIRPVPSSADGTRVAGVAPALIAD